MNVGEQWWWWFSLARDKGGPTYYPGNHGECPTFFWYFSLIEALLVLLTPVLALVFLLPSFRKKQWPTVLVVLLCLLTGTYFLVVLGSSSWLVGEVGVQVSVGPGDAPTQGKLGLGAGLSHVNLTYRTQHLALNEAVELTTDYLTTAHRTALKKGWPWALVELTAELGDEWPQWQGSLGRGLRVAGLATYCFLVAAVYVWVVWVVLFAVAPGLTPTPLILSGALLNICSLSYALCLSLYSPAQVMVAGQHMKLHLGYAWWLTTFFGAGLTITGIFLFVYDAKYPGHLSIILNLDFHSDYETDETLRRHWIEPLTAYTRMQETYTQGHFSPPPESGPYSPDSARYETKKNKIRDANTGSAGNSCIKEASENDKQEEKCMYTNCISFKSENEKAEIPQSDPEDASTPVTSSTTLSPSLSCQTPTGLAMSSLSPHSCRRRTPEQQQAQQKETGARPSASTRRCEKVHSKLHLTTPAVLSRKSPLRSKSSFLSMLLSEQERGEVRESGKKLFIELEESKTDL